MKIWKWRRRKWRRKIKTYLLFVSHDEETYQWIPQSFSITNMQVVISQNVYSWRQIMRSPSDWLFSWFQTSIGRRNLQLSPRIITSVDIYLHICDGEGLGYPLKQYVSYLCDKKKLKKLKFFFFTFLFFTFIFFFKNIFT